MRRGWDRIYRLEPTLSLSHGAEIGKGCHIHSHAVIKSHAAIRDQVEVGHFSVIGGDPQYLSFNRSISSKVVIGECTRIGEGVTIHRSIEKDGETYVGENCFLMGACHVAHDCVIENQAVLANGVLLGGHVLVGSESFLGGGLRFISLCELAEVRWLVGWRKFPRCGSSGSCFRKKSYFWFKSDWSEKKGNSPGRSLWN